MELLILSFDVFRLSRTKIHSFTFRVSPAVYLLISSLNNCLENCSKSFSIFVLFPSSAFCNAKFTRALDNSPPDDDILSNRIAITG